MNDMANAVKSFGPTWQKSDPSGYTAWKSDYDTLVSKYNEASVVAKAEILGGHMTPLLSNDVIPAETGYQGVINSLQQNFGTTTKGDLQDLFNRIQQARVSNGLQPYVENTLVQPTKGSDADLNVMNSIPAVPSSSKKKVGLALFAGAAGLLGYAAIQMKSKAINVIVRR